MTGWTRKLPFGIDTEARKERWEYYQDKLSEAKEITVFGSEKFKLIKGVTMGYVKIFNDRINDWQNYPCRDYYDICSVCGNLMHVYYVPGTTYLTACSKKCYEFIFELQKNEDVKDDEH